MALTLIPHSLGLFPQEAPYHGVTHTRDLIWSRKGVIQSQGAMSSTVPSSYEEHLA